MHDRLAVVVGGMPYRQVAEQTGLNAESVRRYMNGHAPSLEFVAAVCAKFGVNAQWLLSGRGPMKSKDIRAHALNEANAAELLAAMARTIEALTERVDRLERHIHTLDARVRVASTNIIGPIPNTITEVKHAATQETPALADGRRDPEQPAADQRARINDIADAVRRDAISQPERPPAGDR